MTNEAPSPPQGQNDPAWHWSNYWSQGALTTFSRGSFEAGYDGPVAEFWHRVFDALPDGASMVDLATGNGAIPVLAVRRARELGRTWRIMGVDYAAIQPPRTGDDPEQVQADLAETDLRGETPMEDTGLADHSVALVTSHFGLEYGDTQCTIEEIRRILTRPGRLALLMHHPDSQIVQQARTDFRQTRMCLEEERFDHKVSELAKVTASASTPEERRRLKYNPEAERWRRQINRSLERMTRRLKGEDNSQMLRITQTFLRIFGDMKNAGRREKLEFVEQFKEAMQAYGARMESMAAATLDDAAFDALVEQLRGAGFDPIETGLLRHEKGELLGRTVVAELT